MKKFAKIIFIISTFSIFLLPNDSKAFDLKLPQKTHGEVATEARSKATDFQTKKDAITATDSKAQELVKELDTKAQAERAIATQEEAQPADGYVYSGTEWLKTAEVFGTPDTAKLSVNVVKGYTDFPVINYFNLQTAPTFAASTSKKSTRESILDKDGGIANFVLGESFGEKKLRETAVVFIDVNFGGKLINTEINSETKTFGVGQIVFQPTFYSGIKEKKGDKTINDGGHGFYIELPVVYNFVNNSNYDTLFNNAKKHTVHVDASLRIFSKGQYAIAIGGTLLSNNKELRDRVFIGLNYTTK